MSHLLQLWTFSVVLVAAVTWLVSGLIGAVWNPQGGSRPVPLFIIGFIFGLLALILALLLEHS